MHAADKVAPRVALDKCYRRVGELSCADNALLREWFGEAMDVRDAQCVVVNMIRSLRSRENTLAQTRQLLNEANGKLKEINSILCSRVLKERDSHEGIVLLSMAVEIAEVLQRGRAELSPRSIRAETNR